MYPVIGDPPLDAGGVQVTVAEASPAVAVPMVGAPGFVTTTAGVTALEAPEGALVPSALVAVTVKVYVVPLVRPVTVADAAPDPTRR